MDGRLCGSDRIRFPAVRTHVSHRCSGRRRLPPFADAAEADQVIGSKRPGHPTAHRGEADHRQLAQPADGLDPAKALFDPFAHLLADAVAARARHRARHGIRAQLEEEVAKVVKTGRLTALAMAGQQHFAVA